MIRIILLGRTGNNLFQYAFGRVLAEKHGVPLVMDASWFNTAGWGEVSHFLNLPIKAKVVRRCSLGARALRRLTDKHYWEYLQVPVIREPGDDQSFDGRMLDAPNDCVVMGYFQSPRYFTSMAEALRMELNGLIARGAQATTSYGGTLISALSTPDAVAVHVRRGDYLKLPIFQVCDSAYYQDAMRQMRERVPGARFYVFSDDAAWCRSEFRDADQVVMDSGQAGSNPLHDMHLMSLASHHIIANSSYSWWAAWLGAKPGQEVVMPERWYAHGIKAPMEEKRW